MKPKPGGESPLGSHAEATPRIRQGPNRERRSDGSRKAKSRTEHKRSADEARATQGKRAPIRDARKPREGHVCRRRRRDEGSVSYLKRSLRLHDGEFRSVAPEEQQRRGDGRREVG